MPWRDSLMRVINRFPALLLRSPLHGVMSGGVLLLSFVGRRSGQRYTTPINYLREGDAILMTTDSPWWRNVRGGAPVTLRLQGRDRAATAEVITDEAEVAAALRAMLRRFPRYGTFANIRRQPDGSPNEGDIANAVRSGRVVVRARLADAATGAEEVGK